jgi:hypothetical protein
MTYLRNLARKVAGRLLFWARPDQLEVVTHLIMHTASLEIPHGESLDLAPMKGCCGPFRLSGNGLPVFKYRVFDPAVEIEGRRRLEAHFVEVIVEISKPDRIHFRAQIDSKTNDPELHERNILVKEKYKDPFFKLSAHLFGYFPFHRKVS